MAQPANAQGAGKGRGNGRGPSVRVGHSKAGPSAPAEKVDTQLLEATDDDNIEVENDSTSTEKSK